MQKNDKPRLVAYVAGIEWQNIVALELYYHRSCYREYTRPNRPCGGIFMLESDAIEQLYEFIYKRVIQEGEVMLTKEFVELYSAYCENKSALPDVRTLVDLITQHFVDEIGFWTPRQGSSFIYSDKVPKGQIIEILTKKLQIAKERIHDIPIEDNIKTVANSLTLLAPGFLGV